MPASRKAIFRSGTSNISLVERNKKEFPPEFQSRTHLSYYASLFNSLEVNSTFYRVPRAATMERWALSVPQNFRFTFKLWRDITHVKNLDFDPEHIHRFMNVIDHIGSKKGCLLVQFPASINDTHYAKIEKLLNGIEEASKGKWRLAVEFRSRTLYNPDIFSLLNRHGATLVLHDMPASGISVPNEGAPFVFLRFHGPKGDYRGSYTDEFLQDHANRIRQWLNAGLDVYAYFNNTADADAPKNLITLNNMVSTLLQPKNKRLVSS